MVARDAKKKKSFGEKLRENWNGFSHFMYDKQKGEVMGRDCKSWAKIGLFYVVYYSCLAGFFAAMLAVFLHTLNDPGKGGPKLTQYLDSGPGLHTLMKIDSFDSTKPKSYEKYTNKINDYLDTLATSDYGAAFCPESNVGYKGDVPCRFNTTLLGPCSGINDASFGYSNNTPCQIVMINRVFDWVPENYGKNYLSLVCSVKAGDATVEAHPQGFLISAFPYKGQSFYRPPPVAVQIKPKGKGEVRIRCFLQGKGIKKAEYYDATRAFGNTDFKVQL